jgi:NAD+ kinase
MHADLDRCLNQGYRANMRMRFTCTVFRSIKRSTEVLESEQFDVLNEIVIDRGPSPWVSNLELFMDEKLLTIVQADGLILSTPTGSTAYSLSAGGSLVHPSIPAILVSPICPHTLSFRPMLLPDSAVVKVCVPKSSRATAYISFDGRNRVELRKGDYVEIQASRFPFPTVAKDEGEWVDSVCRTFQWNQRERQKPIGTAKQRNDDEDSDGEEPMEEWDIDDSALGSSIGGLYGVTPRSDSVGSLSGWGTPERQDSVTGLAAQMNQMRVGKA